MGCVCCNLICIERPQFAGGCEDDVRGPSIAHYSSTGMGCLVDVGKDEVSLDVSAHRNKHAGQG